MNDINKLQSLVEQFARNIDEYKSGGYDEENTKIDYIDRLFELLGWDVYNKQGYSEDYREVVREDKVIIKGRPKSPDYSFRFGKERLFFVEAKKPSVNIHDDIKPAYQVRRYGYSAGLPVSILTDFEEFAIYDTTVPPKENDKASVARIFYCKYTDYEKNWDFLYNTISKDAVLKGKFKEFTKKGKGKKGTQTVDKELLKMIEQWRDLLAKNIALRNDIDIYQLNEAVQKIIDRIIFLRMAEDRNTEKYGTLKMLTESGDIYHKLVLYFNSANKKYNSGLFKVIDWLDNLNIDDKVLSKIISDLYYPNPYEFSVIPIEILGHIYEQFLGKTIRFKRKTKYGHSVEIEEKPEVRKAGGVYYTPKYIVDYIVENTVGELLNDKTPQSAANIRILDPACGSGSFLVGAYKFLLDYHLKYWTQQKHQKKALRDENIFQFAQNEYRLTIKAKRAILLNNIFGVDIDPQAVEVTKLSLLLTMMEGEIIEAGSQLFFKGRREALLPDLDSNIKCGNSLIGSDFYTGKDLSLFDADEMKKINAFDWDVEFKEIMDAGGFDAVIGNPPYVNMVAIEKEQRNYFKKKYKTCKNKSDLYSFFIEKVSTLTNEKNNGRFGFIIPHTWLATKSFELLRKLLLDKNRIEKITEMGFKVFNEVIVSTVILICSYNKKKIKVENKDFTKRFTIPTSKWIDDNYCIDLNWSNEKEKIYSKLKQGTEALKNIIQFSRGIKTSNDKKFISKIKKNDEYKKVYRGRNIKAYSLNWEGEYIWYRPDLMKKKVGCLPHTKEFFEIPEKLITQRVNSSMKLLVAYDNQKNYFLDTTNVSRYESWNKNYSLKFICGLLNSKLINYWYCKKYKMPTIGLYELHSIPIKTIDFDNPQEKAQHDKMVKLVEQMLEAQKEAHNTENKTAEQIKFAKQRCDLLDKQIDALVYELYGLTDEEIKIVEQG